MKITAQLAGILSIIFAIVCYGVAITGFTSLDDVTDPQRLSDAKGFAWFWAFLGTIGVVFAGVSRWMVKGMKEGEQ